MASGRRAADVALRLVYADAEVLGTRTDPLEAIRVARAACPDDRPVVILATYNAMLEVRRAILGSRAASVADAVA